MSSFGHEVQSISQHINLRKQNKIGRQQDLIARASVTRKLDLGVQGTYLERFYLFEKRFGAFLKSKLSDRLNIELKYLQGFKTEILPEKQTILSSYYSLTQGITSFIILRDTRYSVTHINNAGLGFEIETFPNFIIVPQVNFGKATFNGPAETKDVYSSGLKVIYYKENHFSFSLFGYKGREISQGLIGRTMANLPIDTLSGGASASYYVLSDLKAEIIFDHTDYDQLKTEFHTTTLNLTWMF